MKRVVPTSSVSVTPPTILTRASAKIKRSLKFDRDSLGPIFVSWYCSIALNTSTLAFLGPDGSMMCVRSIALQSSSKVWSLVDDRAKIDR